jgi:hypothetical protein
VSPRTPREGTYARVLGARIATKAETSRAGLKGRAYKIPRVGVVARRQLEQRAFKKLGLRYKTLEGRAAALRGEHPPGSYIAAVRFWANRHNQSFTAARRDPRFKGAWSEKNGTRSGARKAYEQMGIIKRGPDGKWRYTAEFLQFWLTGGFAEMKEN